MDEPVSTRKGVLEGLAIYAGLRGRTCIAEESGFSN
jgi:hypothetical protein